MKTPMVKLLRPHDGEDIDHSWVIDRQRPVEICDSEGRRSHFGGKPWVSMRCSAPRGCIARAMVLESDLIELVAFPEKKKRVQGSARGTVVATS